MGSRCKIWLRKINAILASGSWELASALATSGLVNIPASDQPRLDVFLRRSKRFGYCSGDIPSITDLFAEADHTLFTRTLSNEQYVLRPLLPDETNISYNLLTRNHNKHLTRKTVHVNDSSFIVRMQYNGRYWLSLLPLYLIQLRFVNCFIRIYENVKRNMNGYDAPVDVRKMPRMTTTVTKLYRIIIVSSNVVFIDE